MKLKLRLKFKQLFLVFLFLVYAGSAYSQDTTTSTPITKTSTIPNVGGIFLSPSIGFAFPVTPFSNNSGRALTFGAKLEFASSKIYPFVIGAFYEHASYPVNDAFKNQYFLNTFNTKVSSIGGSVDIILSKFIRTDFTIPILGLEARMMNVKREIIPDTTNVGLQASESIIGYGGSLGFTVFIFDINVGYLYAKDFSSVFTRLRFHFPVIKF